MLELRVLAIQLLDNAAALAHRDVEVEGLAYRGAKIVGVPWLGDVVEDLGAAYELDNCLLFGLTGDDDAYRLGDELGGDLEELEARHRRHALVRDDDPGGDAFHRLQGVDGAIAADDLPLFGHGRFEDGKIA